MKTSNDELEAKYNPKSMLKQLDTENVKNSVNKYFKASVNEIMDRDSVVGIMGHKNYNMSKQDQI